MSTSQSTAAYIVDQVSDAGVIRTRKMFGEYALYCNEKVVALICDDRLFVKPTYAGRAFIDDAIEGEPYRSAKPHFQIDEEKWGDREWMTQLIRLTDEELSKKK